jgi:hypothetical protein
MYSFPANPERPVVSFMIDLARRFSARAREARGRQLMGVIESVSAQTGRCRIVDLGGQIAYWRALGLDRLDALGVHVTTVNNEGQPEQPADAREARMFSVLVGDACNLADYPDNSFDLAHSNSTIEHVESWPRMEAFARELRRLAPSYYVQTPYYWFPVEPHFLAVGFHWLPEKTRAQMFMRRGFGHHPRQDTLEDALAIVRSAQLLDRRKFRHLFGDAQMVNEGMMGMTKSLIAIRAPRAVAA